MTITSSTNSAAGRPSTSRDVLTSRDGIYHAVSPKNAQQIQLAFQHHHQQQQRQQQRQQQEEEHAHEHEQQTPPPMQLPEQLSSQAPQQQQIEHRQQQQDGEQQRQKQQQQGQIEQLQRQHGQQRQDEQQRRRPEITRRHSQFHVHHGYERTPIPHGTNVKAPRLANHPFIEDEDLDDCDGIDNQDDNHSSGAPTIITHSPGNEEMVASLRPSSHTHTPPPVSPLQQQQSVRPSSQTHTPSPMTPQQQQQPQPSSYLNSQISTNTYSSSVTTTTTTVPAAISVRASGAPTHALGYNGPFDPKLSDGTLRHDLATVLGDYHRGQTVTMYYKTSSASTSTSPTSPVSPPSSSSCSPPSPPSSSSSSDAGKDKDKDKEPSGYLRVSFVPAEHALDSMAHARAAQLFPCAAPSPAGRRERPALSFVGSGYAADPDLRASDFVVSSSLPDGRYIMAATWVPYSNLSPSSSPSPSSPSHPSSVHSYCLVRVRGGMPLELPEAPSFSRFSERYSGDWGMSAAVPVDPSLPVRPPRRPRRTDLVGSGRKGGHGREISEATDNWRANTRVTSDNGEIRKFKYDVAPPRKVGKVRGFVNGVMRRFHQDPPGRIDKSEHVAADSLSGNRRR